MRSAVGLAVHVEAMGVQGLKVFNLNGKSAVITGAASGIGLATARRFSDAGARLVLADIQDCTELAATLDAVFAPTDVSKESDVEQLIAAAVDAYGHLDVIVNNAGIAEFGTGIESTSEADYLKNFSINTLGVAFGVKHGAHNMRDGGAIINIASLAGSVGFPTYAAYAASKAAIMAITRVAAIELGDRRIRVNCICPSTVNTPMAQIDGGETELAFVCNATPLGRICRAEEAAALIHFLSADDCSFLNGQAINLCGGASAGFATRLIEMGVRAELG
jgi:NAD(P)-dependent dehydrogenase (short-subunit alcohol dehydrogenase family)